MGSFNSYIVPVIIGLILVYGLVRGVNVFDAFVTGAKKNLSVSVGILPALIALMTAIGMFRASGALDILSYALTPLASVLGLPPEVLPLALLRPVSGSGAMAIFSDLLGRFGPDSYIGRVASVMQGSTETTFYTIAVYYGAVQVSKTRHTALASLSGDLTGFVVSALMVRVLFGMA